LPYPELERGFWDVSVTTHPIPGAREALEAVAHAGVPMAVLSNASFSADVIRHDLARHGLTDHLAFVMVTADYVVRKPNALVLEVAAARLGVKPHDVWVVGDRLDTDIAGANAVGSASLVVLSGVTSAADLLSAPSAYRPGYIARDLGGLLVAHPAPTAAEGAVICGGWAVIARGRRLHLTQRLGDAANGCGDPNGDAPLDALRTLCVAAWNSGLTECVADDEAAAAVLTELGLH
jgi:hypothetical protein